MRHYVPLAVMVFILVGLVLTVGPTLAQEPDQISPDATPVGEVSPQATSVGTAFTYQGQLKRSDLPGISAPVNDTCDFEFRLYDAEAGGNQVGSASSKNGVSVRNGLFTVLLDFGAIPFTGEARWLDIAVRCSGDGGYTFLTPRQRLTPAPYALYASSTSALHWRPITTTEPTNGQVLGWDGSYWRPMDAGGGVTAVYTGTGLIGGGESGPVTLTLGATYRLPQTCSTGQVARWNEATATWECGSGVDGGGLTAVHAGEGLTSDGISSTVTLTVVFSGTGTAGTVARSDHHHDDRYAISGGGGQVHWTNLISVPTGFTDGVDNDTTYTVGAGLNLSGTAFSVNFAPTGTATTVARSDHHHWGQTWTGSGVGLTLSGGSTGLSGSGSYRGVGGQGGTYGVHGAGGYGVYGSSTITEGRGVYGLSTSSGGYGGFFVNSGTGARILLAANDADEYSELEFKVDEDGDVYADGTYHGSGIDIGPCPLNCADLAEEMDADQAASSYEPGDVLVVDRQGLITLSREPYAPNVVGVYSTRPAFLAHAGHTDNQVPVALVGVVPVKASAENGPIVPGDLLTTSSTPGHAMRAGDNPPLGTVVGKALEPLAEGSGLIEMLVMLQ